MTSSLKTLQSLSEDLAAGRTTSRALVEDCLEQIASSGGQGATTFLQVDADGALLAADAMDKLRAAKAEPSPYAGIPVSVKDLFDVRGQVTRAGSKLLDGAEPAEADATAVARLRRAGFVVIGRTNMTEFAFSGLGINPHYGTPLNPWDRENKRIPGGSSSGAAISVADGMAHGALGTDTGGSCRIPAAFTGLVGFKPTAARVPQKGALPLSTSLDSIGPIARSVACCAALDAVLSDEAYTLTQRDVRGLRFLVPETLVFDGIDETVAADFERTIKRLADAGATIVRAPFPELGDIATINAKGGYSAAESWAWHKAHIEKSADLYDPRVISRIRRGEQQTAADLIELGYAREKLIQGAEARMSAYDAVLMPTVPIVAPRLAELETDEEYTRINLLALRNPTTINMIDGSAISIPMSEKGSAPTGLMIAAARGKDKTVLEIASAIEALLAA
ncbi:amidase [Nitratireductor aestuarii]|uniref:Amidase n=1 Tax=Nitratireductor aestuarii TaxID=1735103 RepID=A0A916W1I7_9HYPH|nr:amidase [Nitratireductor aestuarii]GGA59145.1 amidase [Nitratireductor aestuarii]